jgi:hypothetical protein
MTMKPTNLEKRHPAKTQPLEASVDETRESLAGNLWDLWREHVHSWLDFRSFLWQRRLILKNPGLEFPDSVTEDSRWKGPFKFAVQATLVTALLIKLVSGLFEVLFQAPRQPILTLSEANNAAEIHALDLPVGQSIWTFRATQARKDIEDLEATLNQIKHSAPSATFHGPPPYSDRPYPVNFFLEAVSTLKMMGRDEALRAYETEISAVESQLREFEWNDRVSTVYEHAKEVLVPLSLMLSAYLFAIMSRWTRGDYNIRGREQQYFLYFIIGSLFWFSLVFTLSIAVEDNIELFAPHSIKYLSEQLNNALLAIDHKEDRWFALKHRDFYFQYAPLVLALWGYAIVRRGASRLCPIFELPKARWWQVYTGEKKIRKDIILANSAAYLLGTSIVLLIAALYPLLERLLNHYRIST